MVIINFSASLYDEKRIGISVSYVNDGETQYLETYQLKFAFPIQIDLLGIWQIIKDLDEEPKIIDIFSYNPDLQLIWESGLLEEWDRLSFHKGSRFFDFGYEWARIYSMGSIHEITFHTIDEHNLEETLFENFQSELDEYLTAA